MIELMLGLGIIYTLYKDLNTLDDVSRLTDRIRKLDKTVRVAQVNANA